MVTRTDDGVLFDPSSIQAAVIREDAEYEGVRVKLAALLREDFRPDSDVDVMVTFAEYTPVAWATAGDTVAPTNT